MVAQLICNQKVVGSNPPASSSWGKKQNESKNILTFLLCCGIILSRVGAVVSAIGFDPLDNGSTPLPSAKKKQGENMRTLRFDVKGQIISAKGFAELDGLVAGSSNYLKAKFYFSDDWDGCVKVAGFFLPNGEGFEPQKLDNENSCIIPKEILEYHEFNIRLFGKKGDYAINTNQVKIRQFGGKK